MLHLLKKKKITLKHYCVPTLCRCILWFKLIRLQPLIPQPPTPPGIKIKMMPFIEAAGREGISNGSTWKIKNKAADTHVLVWADQEAMMNVSLHQAGLSNALLSQHHHFSIHAHRTHSNKSLEKPKKSKTRPQHSKQERGGG